MKSLGLFVLRIAAGIVLVAHGYTKLFGGPGKSPPKPLAKIFGPNFAPAVEHGGPKGFAQALEGMDVPEPKISAYLSGLAEFGGGLAFVLGFRTRAAATAVLVNMSTAIRKAHWKNGLYGEGGYEFPLMLAASAAALFFAGPGSLSLDAAARAASSHKDDGD
jgi:putative oxidoreductase